MVTPFVPDKAAISRVSRRRLALLSFVVFSTSISTLLLADLFWGMPLRGWNGVSVVLYALLFLLVSFGGAQALFGFCVRRGKGDAFQIGRSIGEGEDESILLAPTAVVVPVYNEAVDRVMAGVRTVFRSLERTGKGESFDLFILSDSTDPDQWVREEAAWIGATKDLKAAGRIFYRKRGVNSNKKAGNIADFCRRWGKRYRYMVVFDADSIMSGGTLVRLVRLMEANPSVGVIQTAPTLVRGETLFARILQFAMRLYGPVFLSGLNYWQQGEGNYWGHNAIIRLAPFMEHCALPDLPGKEPFGGKILSHDFVEAALLRRAGWAVWMAPGLEGTYEEGPPTLIDAAKRDRRWCQGNLQHTWVLFARGLRTMSRVHLAMGIAAYSASLVWLTSLLLATLLIVGFQRTGLSWVPTPGYAATLGISPQMQSALLFGWTMVLLFGPKLLAVIDLALGGGVKRFGGWRPLLAGVLFENLFSILLAPILMLFHAKFVLLTVLGRGVRWVTQRRSGGDGTPVSEAVRTHGVQTLIGLVWYACIAALAPQLLLWTLPVLAGMLFSIPFSISTSRVSAGLAARARRLFCTPDELHPPPELRDLEHELKWLSIRPQELPELTAERGMIQAILDPCI
ncbi:MAG: glucans biosynthesis glucosyltransferase MdoH, partial [Opitutaceae bacterium]